MRKATNRPNTGTCIPWYRKPIRGLLYYIVGSTNFAVGFWFAYSILSVHYEQIIAQERTERAELIREVTIEILSIIEMRFCAQWDLSVQPYTEPPELKQKEKKK